MKKTLVPLISIALLPLACKKEPEARYSKWYINSDTFLTNNVKEFVHKVDCQIVDYNRPNYFGFLFPYPPSLAEEPFSLVSVTHLTGIQSCLAGFIAKDTISYLPSPFSNTHITIVKVDGKATWGMAPTWCRNLANPADSALIGGEFSEP